MQNLFYLTLAYFMGMSSSKSTSVTTCEILTGIVRLWFSRSLGHVNVIKFTIRTDILRKSLREFVRFEEVVCFCDCFQKHFPNFAIVKHLELQQLKISTYSEISGFFSAQITLFAIILYCEVPLLCEDLLS